MTEMRIRTLEKCPDHKRAILTLEDMDRRWNLSLGIESHEAMRLARDLGQAGCTCNPICDFIQAVFATFEVSLLRVVLDDIEGVGIGAFVYLNQSGAEVPVACYPPDALALALRAGVSIYATDEALRHACPLDRPHRHATCPSDVTQWLEQIRPEDFEG